jgi:hypothetical protein
MVLKERMGVIYHTTTVSVPLPLMIKANELGISMTPTLVEALSNKIAEREEVQAPNQRPQRVSPLAIHMERGCNNV